MERRRLSITLLGGNLFATTVFATIRSSTPQSRTIKDCDSLCLCGPKSNEFEIGLERDKSASLTK